MFKAKKPKPDPRAIIAAYCHEQGFSVPVAEFAFAAPVREWKFDLAWPELRIALEMEGGAFVGGRHTSGAGYRADCQKYTEAALRGWLVIRVLTSDAHKAGTLGVIYRAMGVRGIVT